VSIGQNAKGTPNRESLLHSGAFNRNRTDDLILTMDLPKLT